MKSSRWRRRMCVCLRVCFTGSGPVSLHKKKLCCCNRKPFVADSAFQVASRRAASGNWGHKRGLRSLWRLFFLLFLTNHIKQTVVVVVLGRKGGVGVWTGGRAFCAAGTDFYFDRSRLRNVSCGWGLPAYLCVMFFFFYLDDQCRDFNSHWCHHHCADLSRKHDRLTMHVITSDKSVLSRISKIWGGKAGCPVLEMLAASSQSVVVSLHKTLNLHCLQEWEPHIGCHSVSLPSGSCGYKCSSAPPQVRMWCEWIMDSI